MKTLVIKTGITGLDQILNGGLHVVEAPSGASRPTGALLIRGGPGTGKTLLAATLAARAIDFAGPKGCGLLAVLEQTPADTTHFLRQFHDGLACSFVTGDEWSKQTRARTGSRCVVAAVDPASLTLPTPADVASAIRNQLDVWRSGAEQKGHLPVVCVLDGFLQGSPVLRAFDRMAFQDLARFGTDHGLLMIVVEEEGGGPDWLPYACDAVIRLLPPKLDQMPEVPLRRLAVEKSRFGTFAEGSHPYDIAEGDGITLYPALHSYSRRSPRQARPLVLDAEERFGWSRIHELPDATLFRGYLTLIEGDERLWVDNVARGFLEAGAQGDGFSAALVLHPRRIVLSAVKSDRRLEIGDFATPPEKLLFLVREELAHLRGKSRQLTRFGFNLHALESFPQRLIERHLQVLHILSRDLMASGVSVLAWAAPTAPKNTALNPAYVLNLQGKTTVEGKGLFEFRGPNFLYRAKPFTREDIGLRAPGKA